MERVLGSGARAVRAAQGYGHPLQWKRCFSLTSCRQEPHVLFDTEISPKLAPLLAEIQNKIILPSYVPGPQRKRIFLTKHISSLKNDPVTIEIDGLAHRFEHIPQTGIPPTRSILRESLKNMETPQDWSNFIRLVSGLRHARRKIGGRDWIKIIRQVGSKRQIYVIIEAARQARRTGLILDSPQMVHEILFFTQLKALEANWEKEELVQALKWTQMVLDMAAKADDTDGAPKGLKWLLHRDPLALSAPLHLASALAVAYEGGKDVDGAVASWAKQLVSVWPAGQGLLEVYPAEAYAQRDANGLRYLVSPPNYVAKASMALHGLRLAAQVEGLDATLKEQLNGIAEGLKTELSQQKGKLDPASSDGLPPQVYNNLFDASGASKFEVKA